MKSIISITFVVLGFAVATQAANQQQVKTLAQSLSKNQQTISGIKSLQGVQDLTAALKSTAKFDNSKIAAVGDVIANHASFWNILDIIGDTEDHAEKVAALQAKSGIVLPTPVAAPVAAPVTAPVEAAESA